MGEARRDALRVGFDHAIKLEFHGATVSSDAGSFPYRDLDEAALLRQSDYSQRAGYEDVNDAERLSVDPVTRRVVGGRAVDRTAAFTRQVGRFETEVSTHRDNLAALISMTGQWVDRMRQRRSIKKLILDLDSSVSETYGNQEGAAYNGHFGCECYQPLFCFKDFGDVGPPAPRGGEGRMAPG